MTPPVRAVVFARLPRPGLVKTRLAASVGDEKAAALYQSWVPPFVARLTAIPGLSVEVCLDPAETVPAERGAPINEATEWIPTNVDWGFQEGAGLTERLTNAFDRQFDAGWTSVLAIGSDSPQLEASLIRQLMKLLDTHPVVLGPAEDGGYYAVGLRQPPGSLFEGVRWSSDQTCRDTIRAAEGLGWHCGHGPMSYDIDTLADLERLIAEDREGQWGDLGRILAG